jgi:hypothetical protein
MFGDPFKYGKKIRKTVQNIEVFTKNTLSKTDIENEHDLDNVNYFGYVDFLRKHLEYATSNDPMRNLNPPNKRNF